MPALVKKQAPAGNKPAPGLEGLIQPMGFEDDAPIKLSLYGRSGTGKTTLWATFPKPILALVFSGGLGSGELRSVDTPENRGQIHVAAPTNAVQAKKLLEHLKEAGGYATYVLDHATGLQDLVLRDIVGLAEIPVQKTWGMATQQQYGQCTLQVKEILRDLLSLPANVVIVAQERNFNEGGDGSEMLAPVVGSALTPSLCGWLNAAVDYIGQTFIRQKEEIQTQTIGTGKSAKTLNTRVKIKGVEYCLRTAPDPVYTIKFRDPSKGVNLPEVLVNPHYDKIMRLIKGEPAE